MNGEYRTRLKLFSYYCVTITTLS